MIAAIILMCLAGTDKCQQKSVWVEPAACHLRTFRGAAVFDGEIKEITLAIRCKNPLD